MLKVLQNPSCGNILNLHIFKMASVSKVLAHISRSRAPRGIILVSTPMFVRCANTLDMLKIVLHHYFMHNLHKLKMAPVMLRPLAHNARPSTRG